MMNFLTTYKLYAFAGLAIIFAVILSLHLLADNHLQNKYDALVIEFKDFKSAIDTETKAREVEIANKRVIGIKQTQLIQAEFEAELKKRDLDRAKSTQAIKEFYEKRLNTANYTHAERLRVNAERNRFGLPEESTVAEKPTKSGQECDTALDYENLENACIITTLDFNACRAALDNDTATVGRDEWPFSFKLSVFIFAKYFNGDVVACH